MPLLDIIVHYWPLLAAGLLTTVAVSLGGIALALLLAAPLAALKLARRRWLRLTAAAGIEVLRNAPFVVLLFLVHFGVPRLGLRLPAWESGVIALALYGSAYFAEVFRAAFFAVPCGQLEASRSLGLSPLQSIRLVVGPQMLGVALPPARVVMIMLLKDSAILSVIAVPELTHATLRIQAETFDAVAVFAITAALYWLLITSLSALVGSLEREARKQRDTALRRSGVAIRYLVLDRRPQ